MQHHHDPPTLQQPDKSESQQVGKSASLAPITRSGGEAPPPHLTRLNPPPTAYALQHLARLNVPPVFLALPRGKPKNHPLYSRLCATCCVSLPPDPAPPPRRFPSSPPTPARSPPPRPCPLQHPRALAGAVSFQFIPPRLLYPAPLPALALPTNSPTSQQADKPTSRQVGKLANTTHQQAGGGEAPPPRRPCARPRPPGAHPSLPRTRARLHLYPLLLLTCARLTPTHPINPCRLPLSSPYPAGKPHPPCST